MKYLLLLLIFCGCLEKTSPTSPSSNTVDTVYVKMQGNYKDTMGVLSDEDTLRFLGLKPNSVLSIDYYRRDRTDLLWIKDTYIRYNFNSNEIVFRDFTGIGWEFWAVFTLR